MILTVVDWLNYNKLVKNFTKSECYFITKENTGVYFGIDITSNILYLDSVRVPFKSVWSAISEYPFSFT